MAPEPVPADASPEGPKTRSKLKRAKGSDSPSRDSSSCPSIKTKKKKFKKPKKNPDDGSSADESDSSEDDYQYIIDGPNLDRRIKVKYVEDVGVEDEIRDLKDAAFKKEAPNVVRPNQIKGKNHRSRNMNSCATCDEPGEDLIICARCPNSFHPSCMTVPTTSKRTNAEPWICQRCTYETNDLNLPRRLPKVLPFSEESRFNSVVEETLKKEGADGNVPFERALEIYGNLSNPRTFALPRELLDELVDMPFMEHIPRKRLCQSDAICFVCKEHHTEKNPCIQCDYCPAAFHLHCQNIPMTAILNEFWMCPLHAEIAIDRFALTSVSISSRMFLWNRSRTAIKGKKTFKSFIQRTKQLRGTQTKLYSFDDIPAYIDSLMLKKDPEVEVPKEIGRSRASRSFSLPKPLTRSSSRFSKTSSVNSDDGQLLNSLFDEPTDDKEDETPHFGNRIVPHRPYPQACLSENPENSVETLLRAAEYLNQYKTEISDLKNYCDSRKYDMDKCFERKSENVVETVESRDFPLQSAPFDYYDPDEMMEERSHYSVQDLRPAATYVSSSGGEKSTAGMAYVSVTDLYYDDSHEDYRQRAIHRLKTYHKSLLKEEENPAAETSSVPIEIGTQELTNTGSDNSIPMPKQTDIVNDESRMDVDEPSITIPASNTQMNNGGNDNNNAVSASVSNQSEENAPQQSYKLNVHKFGNLFDGQLGFPIKAYYFVRYYGVFHTNGEKIFIRYSRADPENQMSLPRNVPDKILEFAPEVFTECYQIEELQSQSNVFANRKENTSLRIFATIKDSNIWFQCFNYLKTAKNIRNRKEVTFELMKAVGFRFKKNKKNKLSIIPPTGNKETIMNKVADIAMKICRGEKVKEKSANPSVASDVKEEPVETIVDDCPDKELVTKGVEKDECPPSPVQPSPIEQEDPITISGLEKEFEESDESVPASVKQESEQQSTSKLESEEPQEEARFAAPRELRRWSSVTSNDDINIDDINLEGLDLDSLIPEKPSEPDMVDKDTKDYLVETPDFRRYLRKANAEIASIRKLVIQLKKMVGYDVDETSVVRKVTKRKKMALSTPKKQPPKRQQEPSLERFTSRELLTQILEGRKRFADIIEDHRAEGMKKVQAHQPQKAVSPTPVTSALFPEILEGRRTCRGRLTSLNESMIAKANFNAPPSSEGTQNPRKPETSGSTQQLTSTSNKRRAGNSESQRSSSESQETLKPAKRQMGNVEISGSNPSSKSTVKVESVTTDTTSNEGATDSSSMEVVRDESKKVDDDVVFVKPELPKKSRGSSPSLKGKVDLFRVYLSDEDPEQPMKFAVKAVAEGGQEKWYNVTLPEDFYEGKSKKKREAEKVKKLKEEKEAVKEIKKSKKTNGKKADKVKKPGIQKSSKKIQKKKPEINEKSRSSESVPSVKEEKISKPVKKPTGKKSNQKRNPPPDPTKSSTLAKRLITNMLPSKPLIEEKYDYSKMILLQCRKAGNFLYLMYCKKDIWVIVCRFPFTKEILAFNVPLEIREQISLNEFEGDLPGEAKGTNYGSVIEAIIQYERANSVLDKKWRMNAGLISLRKVEVNENAEYSLDQRFLKPDLPIIGALIMVSPVHSYATIPLHYPLTSFGCHPSSTVDTSLLSTKCKAVSLNHACVFYDKLTATVYLRANYETVVDGEIYGDNVYLSESLKCRCNRRFKDFRSPVDRLSRAPIRDNSVIEMGCFKFTVTLMNLEQIWSEIPGTCPTLSMDSEGIGVEDNINDLPDISDGDLTDFSSS